MFYSLDRNVEPIESLERLGNRDILIGIPSLNSQHAIEHVVRTVAYGAKEYLPEYSVIIMDSDGWSTDGTRERIEEVKIPEDIDKLISFYTGTSGKGSAIRNILEVARYMNVKACMLIDSDVRSITHSWVRLLLEPILNDELDYVFPLYFRHKYDATITKHFIYPLMRALYGYEIRQPIGGDVGISKKVIETLVKSREWESENVARYGVDVWMTTMAIVNKWRMGQAALGVKIHDAKDPVSVLAPMFRQVIGTCFDLAGKYVDDWIDVSNVRDLPMVGRLVEKEPEPVQADYEALFTKFNECFAKHMQTWERYLLPATIEYLRNLKTAVDEQRLFIINDDWARLVYDFMIAFNRHKEAGNEILESMTSLYFIIVADYMNKAMNKNTQEGQKIVHEQAEAFLTQKGYLVDRWKAAFRIATPK